MSNGNGDEPTNEPTLIGEVVSLGQRMRTQESQMSDVLGAIVGIHSLDAEAASQLITLMRKVHLLEMRVRALEMKHGLPEAEERS